MNESQLSSLLRPILAEFALELEHLDITPIGRRKLVRITVDGDGPHGRGPLLDDITAASQAISRMMDEADFGGTAPYTLEVSSRGIGKPLTEPKHYRRNAGRLLKIWHGDTESIGRIVSSDDASVTIDIDGSEKALLLADIRKAVVQVELNRPVAEFDDEEN